MQQTYKGFWLNPWILHYTFFIVCYLQTLRVLCVSPNINVKTLYSLSRERWIACFCSSIHCSLLVFVSTNYWSYCSKATLPEWFWQWTQKGLLMFGSIASETELSKPFWCICWWVIYRTTTSVDLVICWLHCESKVCLAQEHKTMSQAALEPGPLAPESSVLTTRPPPLPSRYMTR